MIGKFEMEKRAGLFIPLSSLRSHKDWGIGDITALKPLFHWMQETGLSLLQLLPLNDLGPQGSCPYTALSAFALDPAYIALDEIPELQGHALSKNRPAAEKLRDQPRVHFTDLRRLKLATLETAFQIFQRRELDKNTSRARAFDAFIAQQRHWLEDYALFRVIKEKTRWQSWTRWPKSLRNRDPKALADLAKSQIQRLRFHQYLQWILYQQWQNARQWARESNILLYGDIPFGIGKESSDVWARRHEFDLSASMGAPPDQYSKSGQNWGLPLYRWSKMEKDGHLWWRARIRWARTLFDLYRIDHAVGFFRTWVIAPNGKNRFDLQDARAQGARGRHFFKMVVEESQGAQAVAEDLGLVPSYVHQVLSSLEIPGYKVTRWEKERHGYKNPRSFPACSVATTGNHDTSTLAAWWEEIPQNERDNYWAMISGQPKGPPFSSAVHHKILESLYFAGSALVILPFQDILGSKDRINIPGTTHPNHWTYRMPCSAEELRAHPMLNQKSELLRGLAEQSGRLVQRVETVEKTC